MPEQDSPQNIGSSDPGTEQKGKNDSKESLASPIAKTSSPSDSSPQVHKKKYRVRCPDCSTLLATGQTEEQAKHLLSVHQVSCSAKDNEDTETEDKAEDKHVKQFVQVVTVGILTIVSIIVLIKGFSYYKKWKEERLKKMKELDDKEKEGLK